MANILKACRARISARMIIMDRNMMMVALLVLIIVVVGVYITQNNGGISSRDQGTATYYVIDYMNNSTGGTGVATLLSDGSYRLSDGTIIPKKDITNIGEGYRGSEETYCCPSNCPLVYDPVCGADGNTYVNVCGAALSNVRIAHQGICNASMECDWPCTEPNPELRFVCADGNIVRNRIDCQGNVSCPYVVSRHYVCPDGSEKNDPADCSLPASFTAAPAGIQTIYVCSDGREVAGEADCSANCVPATLAVTHVSTDFGSGGAHALVYECWDGSYVKSPKDCPAFCGQNCRCGNEYSPVCVNGRTYRNPCLARCDGATAYTEGRCGQPPCASVNEACTPAGLIGSSSLTHLAAFANPSCCEEGSYCSANRVCVPQEICKPKGEKCSRPNVTYSMAYVPSQQGDCCAGLYCDESSICSERSSCGTSGSPCGYASGLAAAPAYLGACCEGYTCSQNKCAIDQCVAEYGSCRSDAECCNGMECSDFGQCKKPCVQEGASCKSSIECCGELSCVDNKCAKKEDTPNGTLCSGATSPEWGVPKSCVAGYYNGAWGTYCGFCKDARTESRYYCVLNYTYTLSAMPIGTLTDQVALSSITCQNGCSGDSCK